MEKTIDFNDITLRCEYSRRGGGIEIDLTPFGYDGEKMTSYQNYLGGGMLGSIQNDCTIDDWYEDEELCEIGEQLNRYYHSLTNPEVDEWDEWSSGEYEEIQNRPSSGY